MEKKKTKLEFSAGGVLYKIENEEIMVMLVFARNGKVISLPKGLIERKEKPEEAAVREVKEETGCLGEVEDFLEKIDYWYYLGGERIHKYVYYYLLKYISGDPVNHDWEVEKAEWHPIDRAVQMLTFENEREVLKRAREKIRSRLT